MTPKTLMTRRGIAKYFSRKSINGKLTLLTVTSSAVTLLVACAAFVTNDVTVIRHSKVMQLTALAEVLASNSTAALSFDRSSVAEELLESLKNRPSIKYASIYDNNGRLFAKYIADRKAVLPQVTLEGRQPGYYFNDDGHLEVVFPIVEDGNTLGTICLYESMSDLTSQLAYYGVIVVVVIILSLLIAVVFSFRLQRLISAPIMELATTAKRISTEGDYSVRVSPRSDDELGILYEQFNLMLERIQQGERSLHEARDKLEIRVKQRTAELEELHKQLLETASRAGMAEVATSVLHNVGNILNSINVSAELIREQLRKSELTDLSHALAVLDEHKKNLAAFIAENPRGKHLAPYLIGAGHVMEVEYKQLSNLSDSLVDNITHMKSIVAMQQSYTQVSGLTETLSLAELIDDVIEMHGSSLQKYGINLVRRYVDIPDVTVDKHRLVQILVNLLKNAKEALVDKHDEQAAITISLEKNGTDHVRIAVADNGIGIRKNDLDKIFTYGFTTKESGHGYGLHSCANLAGEMGASLSRHSDGHNKGATFTIDLPIVQVEAPAMST